MPGHDVVISGIGANFPRSTNLQDFGRDILANKYLPGETSRWCYDPALGIKSFAGVIDFEYFDDNFYGMSKRLAKCSDPHSKLGYLRTFEAFVDAGLHPDALRGANVNVYVGAAGVNEYEQTLTMATQSQAVEGYSVMGTSRTMYPNRISYFFDFKGQSMSMDSSTSVGHMLMQQASDAVRSGQCVAAVVVATSLCRYPQASRLMMDLGFMSPDGLTRSFDQNGQGSVRSDGCVAFVLQPGHLAKRCYATVVAASSELVCRGSRMDITLLNPHGISSFLTNLYKDYSIDPKRIAYLEADGSGNALRDECELNAIDFALMKNLGRQEPLRIGSVKSNVGDTNSASAFAGICKAIVALETGIIPATINYTTPNAGSKGLLEGRLQVGNVNEPLRMSEDSVIAINSLGLSSTVGHTILKANPRPPQQPQNPADHLPRLITVSGRTEETLKETITKIQEAPFDTNYYRLVQDAFSRNIRGYDYRSYVICPSTPGETTPIQRMERQMLWFVYSGMGSQWAGMGAGLMSVPIFRDTIDRLHSLLEPKGVDLKTIITETGDAAFNNILKSFVGITACQIALTNIMFAVGVQPHGIIGHSVGELACAYADGCLTEEQAILAAWARGHASNQAKLVKGMMAAIGLGYKDILSRLPPTIDVACHNSDSSCTISGPVEDVEKFVKKLTDEGVFARAVNVSDIAYHSRYIQPAAPFLRAELEKVIPNPKPRSHKWVSTSVPLDKKDTDLAKYCSAEYQTNNLLSPVLFEEGLLCLPQKALIVELAPHGLLQAILKRALPEAANISLCQRGHANPVHFLLSAIGKTSFGSVAPNVAGLYPDIELPVPRGTASLAPLVVWPNDERIDGFELAWQEVFPTQVMHNDSPFIRVNGVRLNPLSELFGVIWRMVAKYRKQPFGVLPFNFADFHVDCWKHIPTQGTMELITSYLPGTTLVEMVDITGDLDDILIHGSVPPMSDQYFIPAALPAIDMNDTVSVTMTGEELYRDMAARGLQFHVRYKKITSIQMGERDWMVSMSNDSNWSNLIETLFQVFILRDMEKSQELCLPRTVQRMSFDPSKSENKKELVVRLNLASGVLSGDGIYVAGVTTAGCPADLRLDDAAPAALQFVGYGETQCQNVKEFLRLTVDTVLEPTQQKSELFLMELPNGTRTTVLSKALVNAFRAATGVEARMVTLTPKGTNPPNFKGRVPLLVSGPATLAEAVSALAVGVAGALLVWSGDRVGGATAGSGMAVLAEQKLDGDWLTLLRREDPMSDAIVLEMKVASQVPAVVPSTTGKVILVWRGLPEHAVETAVKEVESVSYAGRARLVFIQDAAAPTFSLTDPLYADQLARGVRVNVLVEGRRWGSWKTLPLPKPARAALSASRLDGVKLEFLATNPLEEDILSGHVDFVGVEAGAKGGRIMGIGQWLGDRRRPKLDPVLRWPVPEGWAAAEAATVPYVYSVAYLSLKVHVETRKGESILINDATSAIGQAVVRVATQLGCSPIYTTVKDEKDRDLLLKIFPQLERGNVLTCGDGGSFETRLRYLTRGQGVRLVFNTLSGKEMSASLRCVGMWGRMVHYKRADMLAGSNIGLNIFLSSVSVYGFSGNELFTSSDRHRSMVFQAVMQGLREGVVKPLVGAKIHNALDTSNATLDDCKKAIIEVGSSSPSVDQQCDPRKCYVIVGGQASDALLVASKLSLLGAKHVLAAVGSSPSSATVRQRQRVLRSQRGTHLHVQQVREWNAEAAATVVKAAAGIAPIHTTVVIAKDDGDIAVPALLGHALPQDAGLVLLAESATLARQLAAVSEQCSAKGRRTACLAGPLSDAAEYLVELVSDMSSGASVTVLPSCASTASTDVSNHPGAVLPRTMRELATLGHESVRCANGPTARELISLCIRSRNQKVIQEGQPLIMLPPLGVLDQQTKEQLETLALMLHIPLIVVESTIQDGIKNTAKAIVKVILERQPGGPYNVMGSGLSSVLALEVQRQLDATGKRGVLFLMHGDVNMVRHWAKACPSKQRITEAVGEINGDLAARRGAQVVSGLIEAIAQHDSDVDKPFVGPVKVIRASVDEHLSLHENDPKVDVKTISNSRLDSSDLALHINHNNAYSQLAGIDDRRLSIQRESLYV